MEIAGFLRNADFADASIESIRKELSALERDAVGAGSSLKKVGMSTGQASATDVELGRIQDALNDVRSSAVAADAALGGIGISPSKVAAFVAEAKIMEHAVEEIGDEADRTQRKIDGIVVRSRVTALESMLTGRPMSGTSRVGAPRFAAPQGGAPGTEMMLASQFNQDARRLMQDRILLGDGRFAHQEYDTFPDGYPHMRIFGSEYGTGFEGTGQIDRSAGIAAAERYLADRGDGRGGRGGFGGRFFGARGGGMGDGGRGHRSTRHLRGLLPGGPRAGAAALGMLTLISANPLVELGAAAGMLGLGAVDMGGMLMGGLAAGGLAGLPSTFKGISDAAVYAGLDPQQRQTADLLRSVGAGLGENLQGIAQQGVLPGLRRGVRSALTPSTAQMLRQTTGAFSGELGGAAADWGKYLGSKGFGEQFGQMMQRDAGYLGDFSKNMQRLLDSTIRMVNAGHGFTDWLSEISTKGTKALDFWIKSEKGQRDMATATALAKDGLTELWDVAKAAGGALHALFDVTAGLSILELVATALKTITDLVNQNKDSLRHMFAGANAAIHDFFSAIKALAPILHDWLSVLDLIATHVGGWRTVMDAVAGVWLARLLAIKLGFITVGAEAAATAAVVEASAAAEVTALGGVAAAVSGVAASFAPLALLARTGISIVVAYEIIKNFVPGQGDLQLDFSNAAGAGENKQKPGSVVTDNTGNTYIVAPNGQYIPYSQVPGKAGFATGAHGRPRSAFSQEKRWEQMSGVRFVENPNGDIQVVGPGDTVYHTYRDHDTQLYRRARARATTGPVYGKPSGFDNTTGTGAFGLLPADVQSQIASAQFGVQQARATRDVPSQIQAEANLIATYKQSLAVLKAMHLEGVNAIKQKQEETALMKGIVAAQKDIDKLRKGPAGSFDPLTVSMHETISQAQQALSAAQAAGDVPAQLQAAAQLMAVYKNTLASVKAEHETGKDRVKQLAEEASLAKQIASTHRLIVRLQEQQVRITDLGKGPYLTSPNAQLAFSFGYKPSELDYTRDLRSQIKQTRDWMHDLKTLARRHAPQSLISTLQAGGEADAPLAHALATGPTAMLREYERLFKERIKQTSIQTVQITAQTVVIDTKGQGKPGAPGTRAGMSEHHTYVFPNVRGPAEAAAVSRARKRFVMRHK